MSESRTVLYAFWTSSCAWRVRAALQYKRVAYEERGVDIGPSQVNLTTNYRAINPSQKIPALIIDGETLVESMAIIQYLEETRPEPTLEPDTPLLKARMREICETVVSGIQPLQNPGLTATLGSSEKFTVFAQHWTERGLETLEDLLKKTSGRFCIGDQLTMADLCLVPQVYNAVNRKYPGLDIMKYPTVHKIYENLLNEDLFKETHPRVVKNKIVTPL